MSSSHVTGEPGSVTEKITAEFDRVKPGVNGEESKHPLSGPAKEIFDVLEATEVLAQSIDFDELPAAIEWDELPNLVDLTRLSDAIRESDPDLAFDLSDLERVVKKRELWDAIDLLEFVKAKRRLDRELEDVIGEDALDGAGGDSKAASDAKEFASSLRGEAAKALVQQEARAKAEAVREGIVEGHEALERRCAANKRRIETVIGKRAPRNPTAVSLHPPGPILDEVSIRLSTVPSAVRHSKIDPLPRIYGDRWDGPGTT